MIEECGFPADRVWFAKWNGPDEAVDDPIAAVEYRDGSTYSLLLIAKVERDDEEPFTARVVLWISFGPDDVALGTEDRVAMKLPPVPAGGPNSGISDLVALVLTTIRKQIADFGNVGSLRDGIL